MDESLSCIQEYMRTALAGQYHATLAMLRDAIEKCPDALWLDQTHQNAYWRIAHHALFFVHLYLLDSPDDFEPPAWHQRQVQNPDALIRPPNPESDLPLGPDPYSQAQILDYCNWCDRLVDTRLQEMDITSSSSGFDWYPISKLEHQIVNIRHAACHAAELADRLRLVAGISTAWVGSRQTR